MAKSVPRLRLRGRPLAQWEMFYEEIDFNYGGTNVKIKPVTSTVK